MNIKQHVETELKQHMATVKMLSDQLKDRLIQLPIKNNQLFKLPLFEKDDETDQPGYIQVSVLTGQEAFEPTLRSLTAYYAKDNTLDKEYSTRLVRRYPGFIQFDLDSCPLQVDTLIQGLNQAKRDFMHCLKINSKDHQEQWDVIHHLFKRIMTHQLKRQILIADTPETPARLRFYWAKKMSSPKVNKKQAINQLEKLQHQASLLKEPENKIQAIQWQINTLHACNDKLVIRRPVRVKPMIKLSYKNEYGSDPRTHLRPKECSATTPVLVFSKQDLKVTPLTDYHKPEVDKTREYETDLISAQLHLYRVKS
ncbi:DNA replication terminus site-binding protein [Shewanella surugensis]|uniref:DNA replication terminus site-binding protein n=1 Tax=Shewanella surugensis TaxID=212020 RepID=A0ABT0LIX3_9GAMM|nr:DNA replication terminus site-binding protein [Shewanella surugensis]MCL1127654.1 DNA replication terminus site-binding protein [Shewanella surugensis]